MDGIVTEISYTATPKECGISREKNNLLYYLTFIYLNICDIKCLLVFLIIIK